MLGAALVTASGCNSDDDTMTNENAAGQSAAGASAGGQGASETLGGAPSSGGSSSNQAGASVTTGGAPDEPTAGSAGAAAGGASSVAEGDCLVKLTMNTSNAADAATPLSEKCAVTTFDGQINFDVSNGAIPDFRDLTVDFFQSPLMGASVKIEDGYDYVAGKGAVASYMDSAGVWNADKGTVSIESVTGNVFVVKLTNVHFMVVDGPDVETNSGEFVANGTITGPSMPGM